MSSPSPPHFPGGNARASLKPALLALRGAHLLHFPGGNARASLKQAGVVRWLRRFAPLPRRKRPGLIEARPSGPLPGDRVHHFPGGNARASLKRVVHFGYCPVSPTHFPGGNARASLKRRPAARRAAGKAPLPRRKRPGLIEAPAARPAQFGVGGHFPGGNARASLKPAWPACPGRPAGRHFPGGNARASLKPSTSPLAGKTTAATSQAETPGPH